jgi:sacsin
MLRRGALHRLIRSIGFLKNLTHPLDKQLRLVLDERSHPTAALASPALASLQGPALLCYNDAQFSEVDFQSIQRIGDSLKKEESQGAKTGRFGVGFNSVYHVTELPTFVSGRHVAMFDPQAKYLPNVNPANPGKKIDFLDKVHRQVLQTYADQFKPLRAFGCDVLAPTPAAFPATLFRFPLRTPAQAEASRLSKQVGGCEC